MRKKPAKRLGTALQKQYLDRSVFLHRSLKAIEMEKLLNEVAQLSDDKYRWDFNEAGIDAGAARTIEAKRMQKVWFFCHPSVIQEKPHLILYYRSVANLTQKGLVKFAFSTKAYESGARTHLSEEQAKRVAVTINSIANNLILNDAAIGEKDIRHNLIASIGITFDGSWRNRIGAAVTEVVNDLFVTYLKDKKLVAEATKSKVTLNNGFVVKFGSDPDVAIHDAENKLLVSIEVKGGVDANGALERYGAARKSFDKSRRLNVRCHTIYIAGCITETVRERIEQDGLVSETQDLLEVISNPKKARSFLNDLFQHIVRI